MLEHTLTTSFLMEPVLPPFVSNLQLWLRNGCGWSVPDSLHPEVRLPGGEYSPDDLIHVTLESYPTKTGSTKYWDATYRPEKDAHGWTVPQNALPVSVGGGAGSVKFRMPCAGGHIPPKLVLSAFGMKHRSLSRQACTNLAQNCTFVGQPIDATDVGFATSCASQCRDFLTKCLDKNCSPDDCPGCTELYAAQKRPWLSTQRMHYKNMFGDEYERYLWSSPTVAQEVLDTTHTTSSYRYGGDRQLCEATLSAHGSVDTPVDSQETTQVAGDWQVVMQPHPAKGAVETSAGGAKVELVLHLSQQPADPEDLQFRLDVRSRDCPAVMKPTDCEKELPIDREILRGVLKAGTTRGEWQMKHLGLKVTLTMRGNEVIYEGHNDPMHDDEPSNAALYANDEEKKALIDSANHGIGTYTFRKATSGEDSTRLVIAHPMKGKMECEALPTLPQSVAML